MSNKNERRGNIRTNNYQQQNEEKLSKKVKDQDLIVNADKCNMITIMTGNEYLLKINWYIKGEFNELSHKFQ